MQSEQERSTAQGYARRARRRVRRVLLAAIVLLYVASVPWYRSTGAPIEVWLGLPDWVAVAVLCYAGVALLNSLAWLISDIDDDGALPPGLREPGSAGADPRSGA